MPGDPANLLVRELAGQTGRKQAGEARDSTSARGPSRRFRDHGVTPRQTPGVDRVDKACIAVGALAATELALLSDSFNEAFLALWAVIAGVTGLIAVNHTIPRKPKLIVEYRNPLGEDKPTVHANEVGGAKNPLLVYVRNDGKSPAEAVVHGPARLDGRCPSARHHSGVARVGEGMRGANRRDPHSPDQ